MSSIETGVLAEDKSICPNCAKSVKSAGIWCCRCQFWSHFRCQGINSSDMVLKSANMYLCVSCCAEIANLIENDNGTVSITAEKDDYCVTPNDILRMEIETLNKLLSLQCKDIEELRKENTNMAIKILNREEQLLMLEKKFEENSKSRA